MKWFQDAEAIKFMHKLGAFHMRPTRSVSIALMGTTNQESKIQVLENIIFHLMHNKQGKQHNDLFYS